MYKENYSKLSKATETIEKVLLIVILILLPFNLIIGKIIPAVIFFPLYVVDFFIILLGILLFFKIVLYKKVIYIQKHKILLLFTFIFLVFLFLGIISVFFHKEAIITFIAENNTETILHSMFKKIISADPTQSVNKTMQILLSSFLFLAILISSFKKEFLLKIICIPLVIILIINLFLFLTKLDVGLDSGRIGETIHPYGLSETGRVYFPFVNSLLLSIYLSLFFFVLLFLFMEYYKEKKKKNILGFLLFFLVLILGLTKGRIAIMTLFILFILLTIFIYRYKLIVSIHRGFFFALGIFIFIILLSSFFTIGSSSQNSAPDKNIKIILDENIQEMKVQEMKVQEIQDAQENKFTYSTRASVTLREADVDTVNSGRISLHWPTAFALFSSEPLFGIGTGMFFYSVVSEKRDILCQQKELCPDFIQPSDVSSTAHSIYLQILAENGFVGFLFFLFFILTFFYLGYKIIKQEIMENECIPKRYAEKNHSALFLFTALLGFFIQGLFFSYFEYKEITYLFFVFMGIFLKLDIPLVVAEHVSATKKIVRFSVFHQWFAKSFRFTGISRGNWKTDPSKASIPPV